MPAQANALTQPGSIGSLTLKNRMIVSAMGVNLAEEDGTCGERIIAYHERQARGGARYARRPAAVGALLPTGRTQ